MKQNKPTNKGKISSRDTICTLLEELKIELKDRPEIISKLELAKNKARRMDKKLKFYKFSWDKDEFGKTSDWVTMLHRKYGNNYHLFLFHFFRIKFNNWLRGLLYGK